MTTDAARLVVYLGFGVGLVAWLWGLLRARGMAGNSSEPQVELVREEVDLDAETAARELAKAVVGQAGSILAAFQIEEASPETVRLRGLSTVPFLNRLQARFTLRPIQQGQTSVVLTHNRGALRRAAAISRALSLLVGLPVLLGLTALLLYLAVESPQPSVRGQAFQILQASHVLWPPFLLQFLGRRTQRLADESLVQLVARLRFR